MHLALDDHVIDDAADVVDARQGDHHDLAGSLVDFDLANLGAVRPGGCRRGLCRRDPDDSLRLARCRLAERDRPVGAGDPEAPVAELDVARSRLERLGGELLAAGDRAPPGCHRRRPSDERRARAHAADAGREIRIALHYLYILQRHTQKLGNKLAISRLQALPHRLGAGKHGDRAIAFDLDVHRLGADRRAGPLEVAGEAAPAQLCVLQARGFSFLEIFPVRGSQNLLEHPRELAVVVPVIEVRAVRELLGPDEVAAPYLRRVDLHLAGGALDQPLHEEVGFRTARAAVRSGRHRVGEHALHVEVDRGHVIERRLHLGAEDQRDDRRRADRRRAEIGEHARAQREDPAVLVERELGLIALVAAHVGGREVLAALGAPLHGTAELAHRVAEHRVFVGDARFHPEAAAQIADHDAEGVGLDAEEVGESLARARRHLVLGIERPAAVLMDRDRAARLERHRDDALVIERHARDMRRARERLIDRLRVAEACLGGDVAGRLWPELRRARRDRRGDVDHARQILVLDANQLGRILRLLARLGDDGGDRLADVEAFVLGERRAQRRCHGRAARALENRRKRDMGHAVGAQVGSRVDRNDARGAARLGRVDRRDARVRVRRAQQRHPGLPGQVPVVAVKALATQQALVLEALLRARGAEARRGGIELGSWSSHDNKKPLKGPQKSQQGILLEYYRS